MHCFLCYGLGMAFCKFLGVQVLMNVVWFSLVFLRHEHLNRGVSCKYCDSMWTNKTIASLHRDSDHMGIHGSDIAAQHRINSVPSNIPGRIAGPGCDISRSNSILASLKQVHSCRQVVLKAVSQVLLIFVLGRHPVVEQIPPVIERELDSNSNPIHRSFRQTLLVQV